MYRLNEHEQDNPTLHLILMFACVGGVGVLVILEFAKGYRSVILDTLYPNDPCNTRGQYNISTYF